MSSQVNVRSAQAVSASREICRAIRQHDAAFRQAFPFLKHQDVLCATIFFGSLFLISLFSYLYVIGYLHPILTIVLVALPISFLHELEHDITHNLYFKQYRWIQNVMFLVIWIVKLHGSPWYRRQLHLKHHLLSGQTNDAEERLIGLGLKANYQRMAVTLHPFGGLLVSDEISKDAKYLNILTMKLKNAPTALIFLLLTRTYLTYNILFLIYSFFNYDPSTIYGTEKFYPLVRILTICVCFPNLIRQGCLVLMSNTSHYYGDIPLNTVYYQNQILDSWFVFPFQLFCMNFGATHIIHHYVVSQPFYIRHFTGRAVKDLMVSLGVRNNDLGILWRNNNYTIDPKEDQKQKFLGVCWFAMCLFVGFPLYFLWDMMVMHQSNKNICSLIRRRLLRKKVKKEDALDEKKDTEQNGNEELTKLNTLVNQISLFDVSADQVEEVSDAAVEAK